MSGIKHPHSDTDVAYFRHLSYHNIIALLKVNILMCVKVTHCYLINSCPMETLILLTENYSCLRYNHLSEYFRKVTIQWLCHNVPGSQYQWKLPYSMPLGRCGINIALPIDKFNCTSDGRSSGLRIATVSTCVQGYSARSRTLSRDEMVKFNTYNFLNIF
jgi:hypothetical protein